MRGSAHAGLPCSLGEPRRANSGRLLLLEQWHPGTKISGGTPQDNFVSLTEKQPDFSRERIKARCERTQARLHVRCMGLLEVHRSRDAPYQVADFNRIQYLHRTTRDYLERPDVWSGIVAQTRGTDFDPRLSLLRACVLQIKWGLHRAVSPAYVFKIATSYARKIERSTGHANIELIDQLFLAVQAKNYTSQDKNFQTLASEHNLRAYLMETNKKTGGITRNEGRCQMSA
jgi:hypothetical protein